MKTLPDGTVDLGAIEDASEEQVRALVRNRLLGVDESPVFGSSEDSRHYVLALIFTKLNERTRERIRFAVLEFLKQLASHKFAEWNDEAATQLLALVEPVLRESALAEEAITLLLRLADERGPSHFRVLQALLGLNYKGLPDFWCREFELGGDAYAPLVIEGLAGLGLDPLFRWLESNTEARRVNDALVSYIPVLVHDFEKPELRPRLRHLREVLPPLQAAKLGEVSYQFGLDTATDPQISEKSRTLVDYLAAALGKTFRRDKVA